MDWTWAAGAGAAVAAAVVTNAHPRTLHSCGPMGSGFLCLFTFYGI